MFDSIQPTNHTRNPSILFLLVAWFLVPVLCAPAEEPKMDEALRGRDMSKILNMLKTREPAEVAPVPSVEPEPRTAEPTQASPTAETLTPAIRKAEPSPAITRVSETLPADPPGAAPHRVTMVSPDMTVNEADPEGVEAVPDETVAAETVKEAAEIESRPHTIRRPGRIGAQSSIPTRIPKLEKRAQALPDIDGKEQIEADIREAINIPNGLDLDPPSVEKPDRFRALGELESLRESTSIVQTNSLIPSDEAMVEQVEETPAESVPATGPEPEKTEESERPLGMLDILAKRFGRTPPRETATEPSTTESSVEENRPEEDLSRVPTPPSSAISVSLDARSGEINKIRGAIDTLLGDVQQDAGQQTGGATSTASTYAGQGWRYVGNWRDGKMDGSGELTYPDGWKFDGEWREGTMHGTGTLTHPDGWIYQGGWSLGAMDGHGVLTYPDGWQYIGEWRVGRMHGTGELLHPQARRASTADAP